MPCSNVVLSNCNNRFNSSMEPEVNDKMMSPELSLDYRDDTLVRIRKRRYFLGSSFPRRRESMKIKGLLDPRLRGDDNKVSFRMGTTYSI